jgi:hypothetical protein
MNLVRHQQELARLVKNGAAGFHSEDPYVDAVAASPQFEMLREVSLWWREYDIERMCVLTASLLRRRELLHDMVVHYVAQPGYSPFISEMTASFLRLMAQHEDRVISAMAKFELAVIAAKRGEPGEGEIDWPCDPRLVLNGQISETPDTVPIYRTIVSRDIPGFVRLTPLDATGQ